MLKYPIGIQSFEQIREDGYVYVDKTDLVYKLLTTGKIYFLSRRCVVLVYEYDKPLLDVLDTRATASGWRGSPVCSKTGTVMS